MTMENDSTGKTPRDVPWVQQQEVSMLADGLQDVENCVLNLRDEAGGALLKLQDQLPDLLEG